MKIFIDSADIDEIKQAYEWGIADGVTTNPSLLKKAVTKHKKKNKNLNLKNYINQILKIAKGSPVSLEVTETSKTGMLKQAKNIHKLFKSHKNVYIKIPINPAFKESDTTHFDGITVIKQLTKLKIKTNCTLIFTPEQALLAAKAGATYVSPFIGRLDDQGTDGMNLISEITQIFQNYHFGTQVLVASIRHPRHVTDAALLGADVCTIPKAVFEKLVKHPMTDQGIEKFLNDWKKRK